jgi:hypothetical protein
LHQEFCTAEEKLQSLTPKVKEFSKPEKLSDIERKQLEECEAIIERGLPEAMKVAEAIDQLSPFKLTKNLEIEANPLFTAFISDLSTPLKKAVARIILTWAQQYLNQECEDDSEA